MDRGAWWAIVQGINLGAILLFKKAASRAAGASLKTVLDVAVKTELDITQNLR